MPAITFDKSHFDSGDQYDGQPEVSGTDLVVDDSSHSHISTAPVIEVGPISLIVANGNHAVVSPNVGSETQLQVSEPHHSISSIVVSLSQVHTLAVDNSVHILQSSVPVFTGYHILMVNDALNSVSSTIIAFYVPGAARRGTLRFDKSHYDGSDQYDGKLSKKQLQIVPDSYRGFGDGTFGSGTFGYQESVIRVSSSHIVWGNQGTILVVEDSEHAIFSSSPSLVQNVNLNVDNSKHNHISTVPTLEVSVDLNVDDSDHQVQSPVIVSTQTHHILVDSDGHSIGSPNISIQLADDQDILDATHNVESTSLVVTQVHNLTVANSRHTTVSPSLGLGRIVTLGVNSTNHSVKSSSPLIRLSQLLSVASSDHRVSSTIPVPTYFANLAISGCSHRVASASPSLLQLHILNVAVDSYVLVRSSVVRFNHISGQPWVMINGDWYQVPVKVWDGTTWKTCPMKRWSDSVSDWVPV